MKIAIVVLFSHINLWLPFDFIVHIQCYKIKLRENQLKDVNWSFGKGLRSDATVFISSNVIICDHCPPEWSLFFSFSLFSLLQGVKIKMDDAGNILIRRYSKANVYIKSTASAPNDETAIGADILKLPNQALESEKIVKVSIWNFRLRTILKILK